MKLSIRAAATTMALAAALGGCGNGEYNADHKTMHDATQQNFGGYMTGGNGGLFNLGIGGSGNNTASNGQGLPVNAYLWRGALETLKFMPLASADPFGGVIITDWWVPPASPDERFKATAYVLSRQLRADGVRVSLFRQTQQNGQWVDAPVDPAKPTELENMVLAKARELRSQANAAN